MVHRKKMKTALTVTIASFLIALAGFGVYANTLRSPFLWDDEPLVTANAYIRSPAYLEKIFTEDIGAGSGTKYHSYRPVQVATYLADYMVWGLKAAGYHLTSIIFHILTALSLFWLIQILFGDMLLAFSTAILFELSPLHTEAVAYVSSRSDLLAGLFLLLSFIFYIKTLKKNNFFLLCAMAASYLAALLSKETAMIFPAIAIIYHLLFTERVRPVPAAAIALLTAAYLVFRTTALSALLTHLISPDTALQRLPGVFVALWSYARLLVAPFGLHMEYGMRLFSFTDPRAVAGIAIFALLIWAIVRSWRRNVIVAFSCLWFVVTLAPLSNIYPINAYMAEHWLYMPSIGFFLLVSCGLRGMYEKPQWRSAAIILFAGLSIFYGIFTARQNVYWSDPVVFYERTLRYAPDSPIMHLNLGNTYLALGRREDALAEYRKTIDLSPKNAKAYQNIGFLLDGMGKSDEALEYLRKSLELAPMDAAAWNNLGNAYYGIGKVSDAIEAYKKAIEVNPLYGKAVYNLGNAFYSIGDIDGAIAMLERSIKVDPDFVDAYNNLAMIFKAQGRYEEAIAILERALAIAPGYRMGHVNISKLYLKVGNAELAERHREIAEKLGDK